VQVSTDQLERAQTPGTSLDPTTRTRLASLRRPALVVGLAVLVAVIIGIGGGAGSGGYLDPAAATPPGARALRVLLEGQGVTVTTVTSSQAALALAGPGDTLLVVTPFDASPGQLAQLAQSRADLVLVDPTPAVLARLAPWLEEVAPAPVQLRDPVCDLPAAVRAGRAVTGGVSFTEVAVGGLAASMCYAVNGTATVAQATLGSGRTVTVVGSGVAFTNDQLATEGDAALALNLLGAHPRLVWYVAANTLSDSSGTRPLGDLLPPWVHPVELQLALAVLALALSQGRRFGPVVTEHLPVVVRAAETAEGRARLYRRAGARGRAAQNLRAASAARIVPLVGHHRGADRGAVTSAVASRTGRTASEVAAVLYGAAPADDAALVRLADELDTLERMVRRT
jgi:Domain of unknown function (DUF4350)